MLPNYINFVKQASDLAQNSPTCGKLRLHKNTAKLVKVTHCKPNAMRTKTPNKIKGRVTKTPNKIKGGEMDVPKWAQALRLRRFLSFFSLCLFIFLFLFFFTLSAQIIVPSPPLPSPAPEPISLSDRSNPRR